jgi:hypothetical protein
MAETTDRLRASASDALGPMDALANAEFTLAMPARRQRWERVQVNTRVRVEIEHVLQQFVRDHDTTVQSCVDLALEEFLTARGYAPGESASAATDELDAAHIVVGTS